MKVAVLSDRVLLVMPNDRQRLSDSTASHIRDGITQALPGWRVLLFGEGGDLLDLRGDVQADALAGELAARLDNAVPVA